MNVSSFSTTLTLSRTPRPAQEAKPAATAERAAEKPRSVIDNLVTTNKAMVEQIGEDVASVVSNPVGALKTMVQGMFHPLLHPVETVREAVEGIKAEPVKGTVEAFSTATGVAFVGSVVLTALAVLAAPLTGGASLAVASGAMAFGNVIAYACIAANTVGILMHQVRGAMADTEEEAKQEGKDMAAYVEDQALLAATWVLGDAAQAKFFPDKPNLPGLKARPANGWLLNNGIGMTGVYDEPPEQQAAAAPRRDNGKSDRLELSIGAKQSFGAPRSSLA
ncbi:MAG TPA: hypothetical protein V6D00_01795 [Pantanalinema sp.]